MGVKYVLAYTLNKDGNLKPVYIKDECNNTTDENQEKGVQNQTYKHICEEGGGLDIKEYAKLYLFDLLLMKEATTKLFSKYYASLESILIGLGYDTNQNNWMWVYRSDGLVCKNRNSGETLPY